MGTTRTLAGGVLAVAGALLACKSEVNGSVTVNGVPMEVAECRSGEANIPEFEGITLVGKDGQQVRFARQVDGSFVVFHFNPGQNPGTMVGNNCGSFTVNRTNTKVNDITSVEGSAAVNCTGGGVTVVTGISFSGCH